MSIFQDIFADLVEKRLWPVAVVLLAGLVAVPLALSRAAAPAPAAVTAPHPPADGIAAGEPVVSVAAPARRAALLGRPHDPFKQLYLPKPTKADLSQAAGGTVSPAPVAGGGSSASAGGAGAPSAVGSAPTSPAPGGGGPTPPAPSAPSTPPASPAPSPPPSSPPAQPDLVRASIDLRFGRVGAPRRLIHRLPPLSALPSASDPVIIYLGLLHDNRTAVFLVSADARPSDRTRCRPVRGACQTVRMRPGQRERFAVPRADGTRVQYELALGRVRGASSDAGVAAGADAGAVVGTEPGAKPRGATPRRTVSLREVQAFTRSVMPGRSVNAASLGLDPAGDDSDPKDVGASTGIALVPKLEQFAPEGSTPAPSPGPTPVPEAEGDSPGGLPRLHGLSVP